MKLGTYPRWNFYIVLGMGALIAVLLCIQCVRTYLYADAVLVPQQAEHEGARQSGAVSAAARSAGIDDPRKLAPALEHSLEAVSDRVLWMRVLDLNGNVLAQAGKPEGAPRIPSGWWNRVEKHENLGSLMDTPRGKTLVDMFPLRLPRAQRPFGRPEGHGGGPEDRHTAYVLEVAVSLKAVNAAFAGLRNNLILGLIASLALLASVAVIGLRAPHYLRGKYLESELQLAKRVQSDLQPKPRTISAHLEFAACAMAADHVGGDFYDIFEMGSGKVAVVLGDVSGKGVPAALLVSVLQGAIRSSTALEHEFACEQINRMMCERTARERFATLFWGVFDPSSGTLRYVNAGHSAPMLLRKHSKCVERLSEGGPVLGLLPHARYSAGVIEIENGDKLIVYSDGLTEAADEDEQEFGETRILKIIRDNPDEEAERLCDRIVKQLNAFAGPLRLQDDRTLIVVKLSPSETEMDDRHPCDMETFA